MITIINITKDIITLLRSGKIIVLQIDAQYIHEIKMWPSGINIQVEFYEQQQKYFITPTDWAQNTVSGIKLY